MRLFVIGRNYHTVLGLRLVGVEGAVVDHVSVFHRCYETAINDPTIGVLFIEEGLLDPTVVTASATGTPLVVVIPSSTDARTQEPLNRVTPNGEPPHDLTRKTQAV